MSAVDPKRTSLVALHMSAFGPKRTLDWLRAAKMNLLFYGVVIQLGPSVRPSSGRLSELASS